MQDTSFGLLTGNNVATKFVKPGGIIFREGDVATELFVIKSGQVRIQFGNRTLTELGPDSIFGEMALIDNEPRSASAIAVTDVENGSVAQSFGFQKGDIVVSVNNEKIATMKDLLRATGQPSRVWRLTILRGGQEISAVFGG